MLGEVEAGDLFLLAHTDSDGELQRLHDEERQHERPDDGDAVGEQLLAEQAQPATVEQAFSGEERLAVGL